jgi:hypothetical protein
MGLLMVFVFVGEFDCFEMDDGFNTTKKRNYWKRKKKKKKEKTIAYICSENLPKKRNTECSAQEQTFN